MSVVTPRCSMASCITAARVLGWADDLGLEVGLLDVVDARDVGQVLGTAHAHHLAVGLEDVVVHRGARGNE